MKPQTIQITQKGEVIFFRPCVPCIPWLKSKIWRFKQLKSLSYHLILVHSSLRVLTEQVEQLCKCLEQLSAGGDGEGAVYSSRSSFTEALMNKQTSFDKATVRKPSSFVEATSRRPPSFAEASAGDPKFYEKIRIEKPPILDSVYGSIKRSRKGIAFAQIQKKTDFNRRQIANAIYKLKEKGMIVAKKRGVYMTSSRKTK